MIKYLNMLVFSALAMFVASPASAEIINLYDLENFLYYGSTNLGSGGDGGDPNVPSCDASQGEFSSPPPNMTCQSFNKGSVICYRNCSCSSEFKYDDSNCPSAQRFVRSGQTCDGKSKSCSCSDDALNPTDVAVVESAFDGVVSYTSGDGSVMCNYLTSPSCKTGKQYSYTDVYSVVGSSFSHSRYSVNVSGKNEPITYELVASTKTQTSGTIYCLTDTYVSPNFKKAVSFSNDFNVNCAKVTKAYTNLNNLPYYYLDGSCNTTDGNLCNLASASATATVSFDFYRPGDTNLSSASCKYATASACTIAYGASSMDYAAAIDRYSSLQYIDISVSKLSNGNACVTFNGCKNGAVPLDGSNGINFETVNISEMVDKAGIDSKIALLIPDETFESEVSYISYPDDASDTSLAGKSTLYVCYKEIGCKVPEGDGIACPTDSNFIQAFKTPFEDVNYYPSGVNTCDGVELRHPLDTNFSVCLPASCGKLVTAHDGGNTMADIIGNMKNPIPVSELRTMLNTYVCPYGLCNADAVMEGVNSNGYVIGNDKAYEVTSNKQNLVSNTVQIQNGDHIHVKCKKLPVVQGATKTLADCEIGDYIRLPLNDNPAVCSSTPLDKSRNVILSKDSSTIIYISEKNLSNEIKLINKNGSSMSLHGANQYLQDNVNCYPLLLSYTEVTRASTILGRLLGKFVSDNNISPTPVYFYLGGTSGTDMFYASTGDSNLISTNESVAAQTLELYYVCGGRLSIK